jgi:branched-chain amino acid transport system permease protein
LLDLILQTCVNALYASSYTALMAVGLVLIFGVMGVINFAHGELFMVGAYVVFFLYATFGWPFPLAVLGAIVIVAAIGIVMERLLFKPMRGNPLGGLIMSVGVLFILQVTVVDIAGLGLAKNIPPAYGGSIDLFGIETLTLPRQRLVVMGASLVCLGLLWLFLTRTRLGWALRACAQDPEAAALQGISLDRTSMLAMAIGAGLAGAAGAFLAPVVQVTPYMGHGYIVTAFIVIIVGGVGSLEGAIVASVIYTFFDTFVTTFVDGTTAGILGLVLMLVVLVVKPTGLFGTAEKV